MRDAGFLCLDGIDGSGKTGAVAALVDHLRERGLEAVATREPGGTAQGEALRSLLLGGKDDAWSPRSELLLMTAARIEHVRRVVLPAVGSGRFVVSDRYVSSTIAYQGAGRGMSERLIRDLHAAVVDDVWPDLTIILDLDPAIGLRRSRRRLSDTALDEGRFETLDLAFHHRVRQSFLDQAAAAPARHVVVDAGGSPAEVRARVIAAVDIWRHGN